MALSARLSVFYSFAETDRNRWLQVVHNHLYLPEKWGWISESTDTNADVIVMLVTADFFASPTCQEEVALALDSSSRNHALIFPILLTACPYETSRIGHLQPAPDWRTPVACPDRHDLLARTARKLVLVLQRRWPDLRVPASGSVERL